MNQKSNFTPAPAVLPVAHANQLLTPLEMELFGEILELKSEISRLTEDLNIRRAMAADTITELRLANRIKSNVAFQGFRFNVKNSRTYEYSDEVTRLEKQIERLKKAERESGLAAVKSGTEYLEITQFTEAEWRLLFPAPPEAQTESIGSRIDETVF